MPQSVPFPPALGVRTGGKQKVSRKSASRGPAPLGRISVQGDTVPQRLRIQPPAKVRNGIGISVIGVSFVVPEPIRHEFGIQTTLDIGNEAITDLQPYRILYVATVRQDDDIARLKHYRAVSRSLSREGMNVTCAPVIKMSRLVGKAVLAHNGIFA